MVERRIVLKHMSRGAVATLTGTALQPLGEALAYDGEREEKVGTKEGGSSLSPPTILTAFRTDFSSLEEFQYYVAPYKQNLLAVIEEYAATPPRGVNIFGNPYVKDRSAQQNLEDLEFYAEMLIAIQLDFGVPVPLTLPSFAQESDFARARMDTKYLGPMRIDPSHYDYDTPLRR